MSEGKGASYLNVHFVKIKSERDAGRDLVFCARLPFPLNIFSALSSRLITWLLITFVLCVQFL